MVSPLLYHRRIACSKIFLPVLSLPVGLKIGVVVQVLILPVVILPVFVDPERRVPVAVHHESNEPESHSTKF